MGSNFALWQPWGCRFSCHDSGAVFVYPMLSECRRRERRRDVLEYLGDTRKVRGGKKRGYWICADSNNTEL